MLALGRDTLKCSNNYPLKCVVGPTEESTLSKFNLQLKSTWKPEELPPFPSAWPCKYEFPRPLVMSNLQLWPLHYARHKDVKVQWQLYGNKYGMSLGGYGQIIILPWISLGTVQGIFPVFLG